MFFKRKIVNALVNYTHGWNEAIHYAIENKVQTEYRRSFDPNGSDNSEIVEKRINDMRSFYYTRMSMTASLLFAGIAIFTAIVIMLIQLAVALLPIIFTRASTG